MVQIIFLGIITIALFVYTFIHLVKENNTNYIYVLTLEFIGLIVDFILLLTVKSPNIILVLF